MNLTHLTRIQIAAWLITLVLWLAVHWGESEVWFPAVLHSCLLILTVYAAWVPDGAAPEFKKIQTVTMFVSSAVFVAWIVPLMSHVGGDQDVLIAFAMIALVSSLLVSAYVTFRAAAAYVPVQVEEEVDVGRRAFPNSPAI